MVNRKAKQMFKKKTSGEKKSVSVRGQGKATQKTYPFGAMAVWSCNGDEDVKTVAG